MNALADWVSTAYTIDNTDKAIKNTDATRKNTDASKANTLSSRANTVASHVNTALSIVNTLASITNTEASNINTKASEDNTKASNKNSDELLINSLRNLKDSTTSTLQGFLITVSNELVLLFRCHYFISQGISTSELINVLKNRYKDNLVNDPDKIGKYEKIDSIRIDIIFPDSLVQTIQKPYSEICIKTKDSYSSLLNSLKIKSTAQTSEKTYKILDPNKLFDTIKENENEKQSIGHFTYKIKIVYEI
jgi:hypothetical protein